MPDSRVEACCCEQPCLPPCAFRIDNAYGDRNLVCACPPLEAYQDAAE